MINLHFSMLKHDLRWSNFLRTHAKSSGRWKPHSLRPGEQPSDPVLPPFLQACFQIRERCWDLSHAELFLVDFGGIILQWIGFNHENQEEKHRKTTSQEKNHDDKTKIIIPHKQQRKTWALPSNNPRLKTNRCVQNAAIMWSGWPIRHWDHWDVATNGNLTNQTQGAYQPKLVLSSCNVQRHKVHKTWKEQLKKDRHIIVVQYLNK